MSKQTKIQGIAAKVFGQHIGQVRIELIRSLGRVLQDDGTWAPSYAAPVVKYAIVEHAEIDRISELGLDLTKNHIEVYSSFDIRDVARGGTPDIVVFDGARWQAVFTETWLEINGWASTVCQAISVGEHG